MRDDDDDFIEGQQLQQRLAALEQKQHKT
jgi:hypothetical protein